MFDYKNEEINAFRDRLAEIRSHMWNLSTRQIISLTKDTEGNYRTAKMDNKLSYMTVAGMYEDIDPEKYYYYVTLLARGVRERIKRNYVPSKKTIRVPSILVKVAQVSDSGKKRAEHYLNTNDIHTPGSVKWLNNIFNFHRVPEEINYIDACIGIEFWSEGMRDVWASDFVRGYKMRGEN